MRLECDKCENMLDFAEDEDEGGDVVLTVEPCPNCEADRKRDMDIFRSSLVMAMDDLKESLLEDLP